MQNPQTTNMTHLAYIPFSGLGLYGGFRGNGWLKNRIKVFKSAVVPSLQNQSTQNFKVWVSWRPQERTNKYVQELESYLVDIFGRDRVLFTYYGVCFWDDKYPDEAAHDRLITALHMSLRDLVNFTTGETVLMTIQPSDDCYMQSAFEQIQKEITDADVVGYRSGYIINYTTGEVKEYNPETIPPFFTIKFDRETFIDPLSHAEFTGPYKSHEYVGDNMKFKALQGRGFLVGTHGNNISTHFNIPYAGATVDPDIADNFAVERVIPLRLPLWSAIMRRLPYRVQRKLRYLLGEKFLSRIKNHVLR